MTAKKTNKAKQQATATKATATKAPEATATAAKGKRAKGKAQAAPEQTATVTKKETTPAHPKTKGVAGGCKSRAYLAGKLLAAAGLEGGVSPELVAKVDELHGKANPTQTGFDCRAAWHAINGYLEALQEMKGATK